MTTAAAGAPAFVAPFDLARNGPDGWWILDSTDTGAVRFVVVGVAIVLLLVFRPQGLLGNKEEALIGDH